MLRLDRQVPGALAPVVYRFQRAGETAFRRNLANDVLALHRPPPDVGEAGEVERRGRCHPVTPAVTPPAEVHIARPGLVEREPVSTEMFTRHVTQPLAAVAVFEGDDKSVGESHQLAVAAQARPRLFLEPLVQHMVQENVGENWRDHPTLGRASDRPVHGALFEHPRFQPDLTADRYTDWISVGRSVPYEYSCKTPCH